MVTSVYLTLTPLKNLITLPLAVDTNCLYQKRILKHPDILSPLKSKPFTQLSFCYPYIAIIERGIMAMIKRSQIISIWLERHFMYRYNKIETNGNYFLKFKTFGISKSSYGQKLSNARRRIV